MYPFAFLKYMFLCFIWFTTFVADYVVVFASEIVFYIQHLVCALKMVDASILLSLFMYVFLVPGFQVVFFSRYCVLVFPSAFLFIVSANFVMMSIFVMVSVFCSPIISVFILLVISFQPPFVWLSIIFATSLSGFFLDSFSHVQSVFCRYGRYVQQPCFYI